MQHWHCFRWVQAPQMWNAHRLVLAGSHVAVLSLSLLSCLLLSLLVIPFRCRFFWVSLSDGVLHSSPARDVVG